MNDEPCTHEDLNMIQDVPTYFSVNEEGEPQWKLDYECQPLDHREYHCDNCDEFFETWEQALEHLKVKEVV